MESPSDLCSRELKGGCPITANVRPKPAYRTAPPTPFLHLIQDSKRASRQPNLLEHFM